MKQLGTNPCSVGGRRLQKGSTTTLHEGTTLYILAEHFPHEVKFYGKSTESSSKTSKSSEKKSIGDYFNRSPKHSDSPKGVKRPSDDGHEGSSKKQKHDSGAKMESEESGESDDEHSKMVAERLKMLQENAKKHVPQASCSNGAVEKSEETVDDRRGKECTESRWEKHDSLLLHYSKGIQAGPKVGINWRQSQYKDAVLPV